MVDQQLARSLESVCDRFGAAAFGRRIRRLAHLLGLDHRRRPPARGRPRPARPRDRRVRGRARSGDAGELDRRGSTGVARGIRQQQAEAAATARGHHRRPARRGQGRQRAARGRAGPVGQGHRQQHRATRPHHGLRANLADGRGRRKRVGTRRRRQDSKRRARPQSRHGCPRPDDDATAAGEPRRRARRARPADVHDHAGRYRAVDAIRHEPSTRRRIAGHAEAAGGVRQADGA